MLCTQLSVGLASHCVAQAFDAISSAAHATAHWAGKPLHWASLRRNSSLVLMGNMVFNYFHHLFAPKACAPPGACPPIGLLPRRRRVAYRLIIPNFRSFTHSPLVKSGKSIGIDPSSTDSFDKGVTTDQSAAS